MCDWIISHHNVIYCIKQIRKLIQTRSGCNKKNNTQSETHNLLHLIFNNRAASASFGHC